MGESSRTGLMRFGDRRGAGQGMGVVVVADGNKSAWLTFGKCVKRDKRMVLSVLFFFIQGWK